MKPKFYSLLRFCALVLCLHFQQFAAAQCNCSEGVAATPVTYYIPIDTTDAPSLVLSFPKFNASIGDLRCVVFEDTLTLVSTTGVRNEASFDVKYSFALNIANNFIGPGIEIVEPNVMLYGPVDLTMYGTEGDSTHFGPDTLFNNSVHSTSATDVVDYIGASGTVDITYTVNGGLVSLQGGLNYRNVIRTRYWGAVRLTYYWCPHSPLAANPISQFTVTPGGNRANISWLGWNEATGTVYEIEMSTDGRHFTSIHTMPATYGSPSTYNFNYNTSGGGNNPSFRVKRVDPNGTVYYSDIRSGGTSAIENIRFNHFPNPATTGVRVDFERKIRGNVDVELVNTAGQRVFIRQYSLRDESSVNVNWNTRFPGGMYYLRATERSTGKQHVTKLIVN